MLPFESIASPSGVSGSRAITHALNCAATAGGETNQQLTTQNTNIQSFSPRSPVLNIVCGSFYAHWRRAILHHNACVSLLRLLALKQARGCPWATTKPKPPWHSGVHPYCGEFNPAVEKLLSRTSSGNDIGGSKNEHGFKLYLHRRQDG